MNFLKLKLKLVQVVMGFCGLGIIGSVIGIVSGGKELDTADLIFFIVMFVISLLLEIKCVNAEKRIKKRLEEQ